MKQKQTFLMLVTSNEPVKGLDLLQALLGQRQLPAAVVGIELGEAKDAPDLWEKTLREFAEAKGLQLVERVPV